LRRKRAIPDDLWNVTVMSLPFLEVLGYDERVQLKALAESFLASKEFSTAGGLELTTKSAFRSPPRAACPFSTSG
jgi:Mlc titration factor MtfA (ptsG expression regulator)